MIGHDHPSIWIAIEFIKKDQAMVMAQILQAAQGQPPTKRMRKGTAELQKRLKQPCSGFDLI